MAKDSITTATELVDYLFTDARGETGHQLCLYDEHGTWTATREQSDVLAAVEQLVASVRAEAVNKTEDKFVEEIACRLLPEEAEEFRSLVTKAGNEWMLEIIANINTDEES